MVTRFILISATAFAIALGWHQLYTFSASPGAQLAAPAHLPSEIPLPARSGHTPLLLVFVHPRCSCTAATLEQLDRELASTSAAVQVVLVLYRSQAVSPASGNAVEAPVRLLHAQAHTIPDINGLLARRFGAATSGEIILYAADDHLLFQGGITPMRSQAGESPAAASLRAALTTGATQAKTPSVFGCPIFLPGHAG